MKNLRCPSCGSKYIHLSDEESECKCCGNRYSKAETFDLIDNYIDSIDGYTNEEIIAELLIYARKYRDEGEAFVSSYLYGIINELDNNNCESGLYEWAFVATITDADELIDLIPDLAPVFWKYHLQVDVAIPIVDTPQKLKIDFVKIVLNAIENFDSIYGSGFSENPNESIENQAKVYKALCSICSRLVINLANDAEFNEIRIQCLDVFFSKFNNFILGCRDIYSGNYDNMPECTELLKSTKELIDSIAQNTGVLTYKEPSPVIRVGKKDVKRENLGLRETQVMHRDSWKNWMQEEELCSVEFKAGTIFSRFYDQACVLLYEPTKNTFLINANIVNNWNDIDALCIHGLKYLAQDVFDEWNPISDRHDVSQISIFQRSLRKEEKKKYEWWKAKEERHTKLYVPAQGLPDLKIAIPDDAMYGHDYRNPVRIYGHNKALNYMKALRTSDGKKLTFKCVACYFALPIEYTKALNEYNDKTPIVSSYKGQVAMRKYFSPAQWGLVDQYIAYTDDGHVYDDLFINEFLPEGVPRVPPEYKKL